MPGVGRKRGTRGGKITFLSMSRGKVAERGEAEIENVVRWKGGDHHWEFKDEEGSRCVQGIWEAEGCIRFEMRRLRRLANSCTGEGRPGLGDRSRGRSNLRKGRERIR